MGNISDIPVFDEVPWHLTSRDFVTPCRLPSFRLGAVED